MRILVIIPTILLSVYSYSQDWNLYIEDESIKIEYASLNVFVDSLVGEQLLFRYSNKTEKAIRLKFVRNVKYSGSGSHKMKKQKFKLNLEPQQVMEGKPSDGKKECSILHLFVGWRHQDQQVESFQIEKVQYSVPK